MNAEAKPLAIDLFCGLGGWTDGLLAEGWDVVGFDIEEHVYGEQRYPAQLVLQDVRTIHGKQFKHADLIVASSPCQAYSYMAMPWTRAKQIAAALRGRGEFPDGYNGARSIDELNELFQQPARIQREACAAAGRFIPMVQENVRGTQPWVGPADWHYGSFYLWGDVPALMPMAVKAIKVSTMGAGWYPPDHPKHVPGLGFNTHADRATRILGDGVKAGDRNKGRASGSHLWTTQWSDDGRNTPPCEYAHTSRTKRCGKRSVGEVEALGGGRTMPMCVRHAELMETLRASLDASPGTPGDADGFKIGDGSWFGDAKSHPLRVGSSKSLARKAASARIAKIPFALSSHIARVYYPTDLLRTA